MIIEIPGTCRIKKNSRRLFRIPNTQRLMNLPSKAYLTWEQVARDYVASMIYDKYTTELPYEDWVQVSVMAYYKGPRPDLSGVLESIGDAFEGILWANDRQIISWDGSRLFHDLKNPRTIIEVEEVKC